VRRRWAADGDESRGGARRGLAGEGLGGALGLGLGRGFAGEVASGMRKPLVASGGGFEAPSVKPVGDGGSAAQGLPARGVKATLGAGCGAKGVLVRVRGQGEPKPGSREAGVVCRRRGHGGAAAGGTPAAVLCQPSGLRPNCPGAKGGTGLQGAHRGVAVDGAAAQGGRRRSPGGGRGRRSRRRSL
jgi:hypothetical protein